MKLKQISIVLCALLMFQALPVCASKESIDGISVDYEIQVSADYNMLIQDECSEHTHFEQATAREDGWYAVYYLTAINNQSGDEGYSRIYVDIFDASGAFYKEISFNTSSYLAIQLTQSGLLVILYDELLVFDLEQNAISAYSIPSGYGRSSGLYSQLDDPKFQSGSWIYQCKKALHGYTKLTRADGTTKQILLDLPGSGLNIWNSVVPAFTIGVFGCLLGYCFRKKKKNANADSA